MTLSLLIFSKTMADDMLRNQRPSRWGLVEVLLAVKEIKQRRGDNHYEHDKSDAKQNNIERKRKKKPLKKECSE